jgi:hypothetical protein
VLFDEPVFLKDFGVYACGASPATDNPECSGLCDTTTPATTCSQASFTCLNLTQGANAVHNHPTGCSGADRTCASESELNAPPPLADGGI